MWCILALCGLVLELIQGIFYVSGHGEIGGACNISPFECNAAVQFSLPFFQNNLIYAEGGDNMVSVLFSDIFDSKIVHDQTECDGAVIVAPEAWGTRAGSVAMWGEVLAKFVVGNSSRLG